MLSHHPYPNPYVYNNEQTKISNIRWESEWNATERHIQFERLVVRQRYHKNGFPFARFLPIHLEPMTNANAQHITICRLWFVTISSPLDIFISYV